MNDNLATDVQDFLITQGFEPEALDSRSGKPPMGDDGRADPSQADLFSFDWENEGRNYGTVIILLNNNGDMEVYYGDNLGRGMDAQDKDAWFRFLEQLKHFAIKNARMGFKIQDIGRLKYSMQGMAAIKEGLFEGYYGKKNVSYRDEPKKVRLMIRHSRDLEEGEARYRAIESLYVETADGERFRVPSRSLAHGRMLARHASEGGTPYDAFGQHINEIMMEVRALGAFLRANRDRELAEDAGQLREAAATYYEDLKRRARSIMTQRGYRRARDEFDPSQVRDSTVATEVIRDMFVQPQLDRRVEDALPILSKIAEIKMKEANEFESWASTVTEGTWALPDDPAAKKKLQDLMSQTLEVGADATNATEALYDLVGDDELFDILADLAQRDPNANIWDDPDVQRRFAEMGIPMDQKVTEAQGKNFELQADDGDHYEDSADFFGKFEYDTFDSEEESPDGMEVRGYIDGVNVMVWRFDDASKTSGYGNYSDAALDEQTGVAESDISGLMAASRLNRSFIVRARTSEGATKRFRVKAQSERVAREVFARHHAQAEILDVQEEGEKVPENLDTDGVMMTKQSNMSSESRETGLDLNRLLELARR
jgi:hypothetical protein